MLRVLRTQRGQSTVELALCLPAVALVLGAVVEVGLIVGDNARLWHAAREAARVAAVDGDVAKIRAAAEAGGLEPVEVAADPPARYRTQGALVTVSVTHRPRARVPLLGRLFERVELRARAAMRIEQP